MTRCAGSDVWADGPFFDFKAVCPGCFNLHQIRPDGDGFRFIEHSRSLAVDPQTDRLHVPEFNEGEAAA